MDYTDESLIPFFLFFFFSFVRRLLPLLGVVDVRVRHRRRGTELAHVGACMKLTPDNNCPESCADQQESDLPVCGSDGNVYRYVIARLFRLSRRLLMELRALRLSYTVAVRLL